MGHGSEFCENDIYTLCLIGRPTMEPLFNELKPFVNKDQLRERRGIVSDIQGRIDRVDRAKRPDADAGPA